MKIPDERDSDLENRESQQYFIKMYWRYLCTYYALKVMLIEFILCLLKSMRSTVICILTT